MPKLNNEKVPMLSESRNEVLDDNTYIELQQTTFWSDSIVTPDDIEKQENKNNLAYLSGPLQTEEKSLLSSQLINDAQTRNSEKIEKSDWSNISFPSINFITHENDGTICDDHFCPMCSELSKILPEKPKYTKSYKLRVAIYGYSNYWTRKCFSFISPYVPGVMKPQDRVVQRFNKFFVISCLVAIFIDPLFFFLLSVNKGEICIVLNRPLAVSIAIIRSVTDFIYLLHMLLQFRLAFVAPESTVVGSGELVQEPIEVAKHYLKSINFLIDLFVVLPLPQIMILVVLPKYVGASSANYAKNLLRATVLLQYVPRILRFLPLVSGQSSSGFIFESAWSNFILNLLVFILAGHVVGSSWYLFGLQRVNQCLREACSYQAEKYLCRNIIDCGNGRRHGVNETHIKTWKDSINATNCLNSTSDYFSYGIYGQAVSLYTKDSFITRYIYSLFWGFQQISTLAGNQIPSYFEWEVLFTMSIIGLGLLLFALLIGHMQNFLLSLGRRQLEMQLRQRDVEQWMYHRRMPENLRRKVRELERFNWSATRGVNEEELLGNLPEELQREIRRHLFTFLKEVRILSLMDELVLDSICKMLKQKLFIKDSEILSRGKPIESILFIVRGEMQSTSENASDTTLSDGEVCGEELLSWCLEKYSTINKEGKRNRFLGQKLTSTRTVVCQTNVEAFSLNVSDLEENIGDIARFLKNPQVQAAIRYASPYWKNLAICRIQVAWKYRKKRTQRRNTSDASPNHATGISVLR